MSDRANGGDDRGGNRLTPWHLLLLAPYVGVLWVPFYNAVEPTVFGFPYFYLYQMAWVVITSVLTGVVYLATRPARH